LLHASPGAGGDHRSLNAALRRTQTRGRILAAVQAICQSSRRGPHALEDVTALGRVSRSTFYNHFDSIDDALAALGEELTQRHLEQITERHEGVSSASWNIQAMGLRATLMQAVHEPGWTRLMVRTAAWTRAGSFSTTLLRLMAEGRERGDFRFADERVALDQLKGLLTQSFASLHEGMTDPLRYIDGAVQAVLQGLGCGPAECTEGLRFSRRILGTEMPPDAARRFRR